VARPRALPAPDYGVVEGSISQLRQKPLASLRLTQFRRELSELRLEVLRHLFNDPGLVLRVKLGRG